MTNMNFDTGHASAAALDESMTAKMTAALAAMRVVEALAESDVQRVAVLGDKNASKREDDLLDCKPPNRARQAQQ